MMTWQVGRAINVTLNGAANAADGAITLPYPSKLFISSGSRASMLRQLVRLPQAKAAVQHCSISVRPLARSCAKSMMHDKSAMRLPSGTACRSEGLSWAPPCEEDGH